MNTLVTGGAGYIGSHVAHALLDRGDRVCILDNLSTGTLDVVPSGARFFGGSVADQSLVRWILLENDVDAVLHFAGSAVVPDSVSDPLAYYENNTSASRNLLEACACSHVKHFIFSSTAAVYGSCGEELVDESYPTAPVNPYGRSKLMIEWMLQDLAASHAMTYVALRYFNVAGADPGGRTGQSTPRATHLIKRACQVALGQIDHLEIFGSDYPTDDGTGVRDYIHVSDLADIHCLALDHLRAGGASAIYNCGYGQGFSVRQVVDTVERACGRRLNAQLRPRRPGDPAAIVADPSRVKAQLSWRPRHADLDCIVAHALAWERHLLGQVASEQIGSRLASEIRLLSQHA